MFAFCAWVVLLPVKFSLLRLKKLMRRSITRKVLIAEAQKINATSAVVGSS